MAGRESVFSDPVVIDLASNHFVSVAENCSPLQSQQDAKGEFFRLVAEQGHYAGRTFPTSTRQGYYTFTADGRLLTAANTRDPRAIERMLRTALERWEALRATGFSAGAPSFEVSDYTPARPDRYPVDGLALRLAARDLPRQTDTRVDDWRKRAWNLDYAWFTKDEAQALVPEAREGATRAWPQSVIRRMALFHLRDFVRGEPSAWPEEALRVGQMTSTVTGVEGNSVRLQLGGHIHLEHTMRWRRPNDGSEHTSSCGYDATLSGEAVWDTSTQRFVSFELAAAGPRWGTNQYNNRGDDLGPAPMGVVFALAGSDPKDRTPPHQSGHRGYWG
ncbi:MAG TPA: hypothetical protein VFN74_07285 [Chloroflexota bacterium]|nr:hypothetical protein [Chloroflexota bacterium]